MAICASTLNIDVATQVKDGGLDQVDLVRLQLLPLAQLLGPQGEISIMMRVIIVA